MITINATCPDHGDITLTPDDVLLAPTIYLVHCPEADHLFERPILSDKVRQVLAGAGVEQLCP